MNDGEKIEEIEREFVRLLLKYRIGLESYPALIFRLNTILKMHVTFLQDGKNHGRKLAEELLHGIEKATLEAERKDPEAYREE